MSATTAAMFATTSADTNRLTIQRQKLKRPAPLTEPAFSFSS